MTEYHIPTLKEWLQPIPKEVQVIKPAIRMDRVIKRREKAKKRLETIAKPRKKVERTWTGSYGFVPGGAVTSVFDLGR
jgi:hypothetical protein